MLHGQPNPANMLIVPLTEISQSASSPRLQKSHCYPARPPFNSQEARSLELVIPKEGSSMSGEESERSRDCARMSSDRVRWISGEKGARFARSDNPSHHHGGAWRAKLNRNSIIPEYQVDCYPKFQTSKSESGGELSASRHWSHKLKYLRDKDVEMFIHTWLEPLTRLMFAETLLGNTGRRFNLQSKREEARDP